MERLPVELTTNILLRLPVKSVAQCMSVSKCWRTLLSDPSFFLVQSTQLSKIVPDILVLSKDSGASSIYYLEASNEVPSKPITFFDYGFLKNCFSLFKNPMILSSGYGFICVTEATNSCKYFPFRSPFYVFNPVTSEHLKIPSFRIPKCEKPAKWLSHKFLYKCSCGFGFDASKKEFKLVFVIFSARDYKSQIFNNEVQIYTLGGNNTWSKKIGIAPDVLSQLNCSSSVALVSGCLHWVVTDKKLPNKNLVLVSFNLGIEQFGVVAVPDLHEVERRFYIRFGVLEECLSVVECCRDSLIDIWVMENYNVEESWVKRFCIVLDVFSSSNYRFNVATIIQSCRNGELRLLCNDEYMVSYNITSQKCRVFEVQSFAGREKEYVESLEAYPFVGSLISLKSFHGRGAGSGRGRPRR